MRLRACYFFIASIFLLSFLSCNNIVQQESKTLEANFTILSPKTTWVYYTDTAIVLAVNVRGNTIAWSSSIDGHLGNGNSVEVYLSKGLHTISATGKSGTKTMRMYVGERDESDYEYRKYVVSNIGRKLFFPKGEYVTAYFSLNGSASAISLQKENESSVKSIYAYNMARAYESVYEMPPLRDFQIDYTAHQIEKHETWFKNLSTSKRGLAEPRFLNAASESERDFYVVNTQNQFEIPHTVRAKVLHSGEKWVLWQDVNIEPLSEDILSACIENIEKLALPRVEKIWGEWADVDKDGKIAILLSPTINEEKVALGFFNPVDLFTRVVDKNSENYNPYSNEMDILYVAIPDASESGNYSVSSISATIAHELTHAITFNKKTFSHIENGNTNRAQEELFLDEGWSHLSENLCGFGVTGGNIHFLDVFLNNTGAYSFCSDNLYGQGDSAGRRGAMTLFLSWLFWKKGGMSWDANFMPVDTGGIQFLQSMLNSDSYGWESIGEAYGKSTDELFNEMIYELSLQESTKALYDFKRDPKTNDPVEFFTYMGEVDSKIYIGGAHLAVSESTMPVLPWSFQFYSTLECEDDARFLLSGYKVEGQVFISAKKRE